MASHFARALVSFLFVVASAVAAPPKELIVITLDSTGVSDPRYLNRANPKHIDAEQDAVQFSNRTVDQTMEVRFSIVLHLGSDAIPLQTQITELERRVSELVDQGKPEEIGIIRHDLKQIRARLDALGPASSEQSDTSVYNQYENQLSNCQTKGDSTNCVAAVRIDRNGRVAIPNDLLRRTPSDEINLTVRFFSSTEVPANPTAYLRKSHQQIVPIGPGPRFEDPAATSANGRTFPRHDTLQFKNNTNDLVLLAIPVSFNQKINSQVRAVRFMTNSSRRASLDQLQKNLAAMLECSEGVGAGSQPPKRDCRYYLSLPGNSTVPLPDEIVEISPPGQLSSSSGIRVVVATIVTGKSSAPSKEPKKGQTAKLIANREEAEDRLDTKTLASLGGSIAPALDRIDASNAASDPVISIIPDHRLQGDTRATANGSGTLQIVWGIGNVADGSASIGYKNGEFGVSSSSNVAATQYEVNYHTFGGSRLQFGKFNFAEPSSKIAVSEEGEGIRIATSLSGFGQESEPRALGLNVSHIIKRQSLLPLRSQSDDHDSYVTMAELSNVPIDLLFDWLHPEPPQDAKQTKPDGIRVRGLNLIGLVGRDEKKQHPHRYATVGGEVTAGRESIWHRDPKEQVNLTATLSYYASRNEALLKFPPTDSDPQQGRGSVGLTTWTLSQTTLDNTDPNGDWLVTVLAGEGSADNLKTTSVDEGYVGETAAFAPDLLFLNSLQPAMVAGKVPGVAPSLSNKQYLGLRYTTSNPSASLLKIALVHLFRIDQENDIASTSTSISIHDYRFRRKVFDSNDAGREVDVEFLVKAPRGVTGTVSLGYFNRGPALRPIITRKPWTAGFSISFER